MRILHVIPSVAPRYGGPSHAVFDMCRALNAKNCETLIATTDADGDTRLPVDLEREITYLGIETVFFERQFSEAFKYSKSLAQWLKRNVQNFDAVHIHAVFSHACVAAARACRMRGVPYIVRPLGTLDPWSMRQKPYRKQLMWRLAARRMLREASAVHYTTIEEQQLAESSLGIERGVVIPLGIDAGKFQKPVEPQLFRQRHEALGDYPYVLAMSRIHPKKNLELLISCFLKLAQQTEYTMWRLVVAGDGEPDYVASLQQAAKEHGGADKVFFSGWLDGAEKTSALQGASLFALTSHQENFGIAVAEALACGVPALVSEHVNLAAEITAACCGWVTALDRARLESTLAEALSNVDERKRRGALGQKLVTQQYSWSSIADKLVSLYDSLAGQRRTESSFVL